MAASSAGAAAALPALVANSERALDRAEREFADRAFAPFWDAVETAANALATFNNTIQQLTQNATMHCTEAAALKGSVTPFRLGMDTLPDATRTVNRMRTIVRAAQKNFQFAVIYEQRKTNQLLVAGFSSLGQALAELGDRLDASLGSFASAMRNALSDVASAQRESAASAASDMALSREQAAANAAETREHERREREMLDNIQRRRKPSL